MPIAGQSTPTGGRSWAISTAQAAMRRVTVPVPFTVVCIGAWGWESTTSNLNNMRGAMSGTNGARLAQTQILTAPYTTGSPQAAEMPFSGVSTVFPAGEYDLAVSCGDALDSNRIEINGQNGTGGTPKSMYQYPTGVFPDFPVDNTGLVDSEIAREWDIWLEYEEASEGGPSITSVDEDDIITSIQAGWDIDGADFDDATVEIRQGSTAVSQVVNSQGGATINCDTVFDDGAGPHLKYGTATLAVINADESEDTIAITLAVPAGRAYVDIGTPNTEADNRITAVDDVESGDQLEVSNAIGGTIADVSVYADGTFDCDEAVTSFDVRVWDSSDATWGDLATQTVGDDQPVFSSGAGRKRDARRRGMLSLIGGRG